jgi:lipoprotein-anchoring transpeptidase ErfK/SrfK
VPLTPLRALAAGASMLVVAGGVMAGGAAAGIIHLHRASPRPVPVATSSRVAPAATTTTAPPTTAPLTTAPPTTAPPTTVPAGPVIPAMTEVATLTGAAPGSATPGGPVVQTVPGSWYGIGSVLPVIGTTPGWLDVRLAQRPDGSTAWIPATDATLSTTPDAIVVDLSTERLSLYRSGQLVLSFPAGIGAPDDPTPPGNYFLTFYAEPPDAGYGPFVLVTSDHSDAITDWDGSGDAIIAIHGPIDDEADAEIGTTGAAISHGCIRLHDADLAQLSGIPAGTPIDIVP